MAAAVPSKVNRIVDIFVSIAASLVIWGALQKILHSPSADLWLKIGLSTEAILFLGYGVLYIIYPPVKDDHSDVGIEDAKLPRNMLVPTPTAAPPLLDSMDKLLKEADITPQVLNKLGAGFQKLHQSMENIKDLSAAGGASLEYATKSREASLALEGVTKAYNKTSESLNEISAIGVSTTKYNEQIQNVTKNLASINAIYEIELQQTSNHLKSINQFYSKLNQTEATLESTAKNAELAKNEIHNLAQNLGQLNKIYGNMLSAMQPSVNTK